MMKLRTIISLGITTLLLLVLLYFILENQPGKKVELRPVLWDFDKEHFTGFSSSSDIQTHEFKNEQLN